MMTKDVVGDAENDERHENRNLTPILMEEMKTEERGPVDGPPKAN